MDNRCCQRCQFWKPLKAMQFKPLRVTAGGRTSEVLTPLGKPPEIGQCHRRAPIKGWPETAPEDWCGEFEEVGEPCAGA
jgi:hypothetical protein